MLKISLLSNNIVTRRSDRKPEVGVVLYFIGFPLSPDWRTEGRSMTNTHFYTPSIPFHAQNN